VWRDFFVASALTNIQRSRHRAARSGNAATLPTLQLASRQAGCATRPAFRHGKQVHERSARARSCHSSARAWRSACMKRSGAEQLLLIWSGCGGDSPQWGGSRDCQAPLQWRCALPCLVKVPLHRRLLPESYPAELPPPLGAAQAAM
jgi:hypothetical protein